MTVFYTTGVSSASDGVAPSSASLNIAVTNLLLAGQSTRISIVCYETVSGAVIASMDVRFSSSPLVVVTGFTPKELLQGINAVVGVGTVGPTLFPTVALAVGLTWSARIQIHAPDVVVNVNPTAGAVPPSLDVKTRATEHVIVQGDQGATNDAVKVAVSESIAVQVTGPGGGSVPVVGDASGEAEPVHVDIVSPLPVPVDIQGDVDVNLTEPVWVAGNPRQQEPPP